MEGRKEIHKMGEVVLIAKITRATQELAFKENNKKKTIVGYPKLSNKENLKKLFEPVLQK